MPPKPGKRRNLPFEPWTETEEGQWETVEALTLHAQWLPDDVIPELEKAAAEGQAARDLYLRSNLRWTVAMAKRYQGRGFSLEELVQIANIGLAQGLDRYDHTTGYRFTTHASWWIRKALVETINGQVRLVRYPAETEQRITKVRDARDVLMQVNLGDEPKSQQIADFLNKQAKKRKEGERDNRPTRNKVFTATEVEELINLGRKLVYLDEPVDHTGRNSYAVIPDRSPTSEARQYRLEQALEASICKLSAKEQPIARMHFGMSPYSQEYTSSEIAHILEMGAISAGKIVRIIKTKLSKMPELAEWAR